MEKSGKYDQEWDEWDHVLVPLFDTQEALGRLGYTYDKASRTYTKVEGGRGVAVTLEDEARNLWSWCRLRGGSTDGLPFYDQRGDRICEMAPLGFPRGKAAHNRWAPPPGFELEK
ncbi:hypothetical protein EBT31_19250, partial [bacterium]|nr:hypothetical protein [bacterium]